MMSAMTADASAAALLAEAERAEAATEWRDAIDAYERCLSAGDESIDEAAVLTALGRCYWNIADARTAWRTLRRAITMCEQRADGPGQARATLEILRIWGPPERLGAFASAALEALGDDEPPLRARLLMRYRWFTPEPDAMFEEAMSIAERHNLADLLNARTEKAAWDAFRIGDTATGMARAAEAHEAFAAANAYIEAASVLRSGGFNAIELGAIDEGCAMCARSAAYAAQCHLAFQEQLATTDLIGVDYARGDFAQAEMRLEGIPPDGDIRADFYRMWIAEARGDGSALGHLVDPDRGGRATTAVGQIHAAAAGALYRAGKIDAARAAFDAWLAVERRWQLDLAIEGTALRECILALGDEESLRRIWRAHVENDEGTPVFSTLQGRAMGPLIGGIALKLGMLTEAEQAYRDGLALCERERLPMDAAACREGLAAVAAARG